MTAFEQQIAREVVREAGPEPRFDALSVSRSLTTSSRRWRSASLFSATRVVVAGAVVALFGGFLLAAVLTQPSEESAPIVGVSASASPRALDAEATTPSVFAVRLTNRGTRFH